VRARWLYAQQHMLHCALRTHRFFSRMLRHKRSRAARYQCCINIAYQTSLPARAKGIMRVAG